MKKLVIIDGKSVYYRGYYAMGALSTKDGMPTGGVYGFAAIAMELVKRLNPDIVVVAWDSKTSTSKRKAIFADYKAGRVKPPEDFYAQIPLLKELAEALNWIDVDIREKDVYLLCSDGLSNMLDDKEIEKIINNEDKPLSEIGQDLVDAANEAGGKDNISAVLVRI